MAYIKTSDGKDKELIDQVNSTPGASVSTPGTTATKPVLSGSGSASNTSGGWTNLSAYLDTNKPQAAQLGSDVAGTINKETNEANTAITNAEQQFGSKVNENRLNFDQAALDNTIQTGNASDQVKKQLSGEFTGPKDWQDAELASTVNKEVNDAVSRGQLTKDVGGRIELLRGTSQNPQTTGNLKLNQLFLQNNEDAANSLRGAADLTVPLTTEQEAARQRGIDAVTQAQQEAAGIADQTKGAITGYLTEAEKSRQAALEAEKARLTKQQQDAKNYLSQLSQTGDVGAPLSASSARAVNHLLGSEPVGGDKTTSALSNAANSAVNTATNPLATSAEVKATTAAETDALVPGWQAAGLTQEQANALADKIKQARTYGEAAPTLADYYTPEDVSALTTANITTPEEAARISALSQLVGLGGISAADRLSSAGRFDLTGAQQGLDARISAGKTRQEAEAANQRLLDDQARANGQILASQQSAQKTQENTATALSAASGAAIGFQVYGPIGAVVGAVIGAVFCFEQDTPVIMLDGSQKLIKDIVIGDKVLLGGTVTGTGRMLAEEMVFYKGFYMTPTHVVYHEPEDGPAYWTTAGEVGEHMEMGTDVSIVCPLVTETHLIVTGDLISADVQVIPAEVDPNWSMNHSTRMLYLNNWSSRNRQLNDLIQKRNKKANELLCSI